MCLIKIEQINLVPIALVCSYMYKAEGGNNLYLMNTSTTLLEKLDPMLTIDESLTINRNYST